MVRDNRAVGKDQLINRRGLDKNKSLKSRRDYSKNMPTHNENIKIKSVSTCDLCGEVEDIDHASEGCGFFNKVEHSSLDALLNGTGDNQKLNFDNFSLDNLFGGASDSTPDFTSQLAYLASAPDDIARLNFLNTQGIDAGTWLQNASNALSAGFSASWINDQIYRMNIIDDINFGSSSSVQYYDQLSALGSDSERKAFLGAENLRLSNLSSFISAGFSDLSIVDWFSNTPAGENVVVDINNLSSALNLGLGEQGAAYFLETGQIVNDIGSSYNGALLTMNTALANLSDLSGDIGKIAFIDKYNIDLQFESRAITAGMSQAWINTQIEMGNLVDNVLSTEEIVQEAIETFGVSDSDGDGDIDMADVKDAIITTDPVDTEPAPAEPTKPKLTFP